MRRRETTGVTGRMRGKDFTHEPKTGIQNVTGIWGTGIRAAAVKLCATKL
jgi:hypothetical protein